MIFNKNNNKNICGYITNSLTFGSNNEVKLCPYYNCGIIIKDFNGIWLDVDKITKEKNSFLNSGLNDCKTCPFFKTIHTKSEELEYLYLANWNYCYVNCCYCDTEKVEDLIKAKHYDVFPSIQTLIDNKLVTKKTKVIFECGDATVHPEFDKILFFLMNYGFENITINTPAFRYCESIAQAIGKKIARVIVPFDAGCSYIYGKIKGINKYDIAMNTIKRYISFQELEYIGVVFKYTIIQGINDNQKEILDWYILSRDLGVRKLILDIDKKWFEAVKNSIPEYLKELLKFAKNISQYNELTIEFSPRANILYNLTESRSEI